RDVQAYFFAGSVKSHSRTVWSAPTEARRVPCPRNVTPSTHAVCPSSALTSCPLAGFHSRTVRSLLDDTSTVPVGWNCSPVAELVCPASERTYLPSAVVNRWTWPSLPPAASRVRSGEKARAWTVLGGPGSVFGAAGARPVTSSSFLPAGISQSITWLL